MKDIIEKIKVLSLKLKYKSKCRKLNISNTMLDVLLNNYHREENQEILKMIMNSKNQKDFKTNIIHYCSICKNPYTPTLFLLGTITNNYSFFSFTYIDTKNFDYENFKEDNYQETIKILKDNFYEYLLNNNRLKNQFLLDENNHYNYTMELSCEFCDKVFDDVINGKEPTIVNEKVWCLETIHNYIVNTIGIYGTKNILENFDFISYDLNHKQDKTLEERKEIYLKRKKLTQAQMEKIENISILIKKLNTINSEESKKLLDRIIRIKDKECENISEIEDIYTEFEILYRKDIVKHLYTPKEQYTLVENFEDLRPQLLHRFLRNSEKFRSDLETKVKNQIISERNDNKNNNNFLTEEEEKEFERRIQIIDPMIDQTQVNYSYDSSSFTYSDRTGLKWYHSDTSNQIATSIYSEKYFLEYFSPWFMGIGFNRDGLTTEAIALSSDVYLTTNKGLNNLEYNPSEEFNLMSSTYAELVSNDGESEVVLFRRNMDYDTKASYVFLTIDSSQEEKSKETMKLAKELADKNNMKLVVYDLYKIRKSYAKHLELTTNIENTNIASQGKSR